MSLRCAGLILAGGEGRRMGQAKAEVELDARSFLAHGLALLRASGCAPIVVVDGAHRLDAAGLEGAVLVHNSRWSLGPLSSLQVGLREVEARAPGVDGLVVHPIERPRVAPATLRALIAGLAQAPDHVWQPSYRGRSGHPLIWPRTQFDALLDLDPAHESARTLIRERRIARTVVEVDDPGVVDNLDTPEAVAAVSGQRRR